MTNTDEKRGALMDKMYELGKRRMKVELSARVKQLEQRYEEMEDLCGTVVATIKVNVRRGTLPKEMKEWSDNWWKRYKRIKKL